MKMLASIKRCRPGGIVARSLVKGRVCLPFSHLLDDVWCEALKHA
jgi:hypothetical protein